jgi:hypothetical protein
MGAKVPTGGTLVPIAGMMHANRQDEGPDTVELFNTGTMSLVAARSAHRQWRS